MAENKDQSDDVIDTKTSEVKTIHYYSYKPNITSGINGHHHSFSSGSDLEYTEIVQIDDVHYISVSLGESDTLPEQFDDIEFTEYENIPDAVQTYLNEQLTSAKTAKLKELVNTSSKFDDGLVCEDMQIKSSLGFDANADIRSQNNIRGLLTIISSDESTVAYMDAQNNAHMLSKIQLETLLNEIITNGNNLYAQKWAYRTKIEACTTVEEVQAITFEFTMTDFSKS